MRVLAFVAVLVPLILRAGPSQDVVKCVYTPDVLTRKPLRGVQVTQYRMKEDDFLTLKEWQAKLIRYQMYPVGSRWEGKTETPEAWFQWLDWKLQMLKDDVMPLARKYGIQVVVDLHVPPGGRSGRDMVMLDKPDWAECFLATWRKIATEMKGESNVWAYDLINEPTQAKSDPKVCDYLEIQRRAALEVRKIDARTPVIVSGNADGEGWNSPSAFRFLKPIDVTNVYYQCHVYQPMEYTHQHVMSQWKLLGTYSYPDKTLRLDRRMLARHLAYVRDFELKYGAKIFVGEFSAVMWAKGSERYIADLVTLMNHCGWSWTYHAFREWPGWSVEYELSEGDNPQNAKFRESSDNPRKRALLSGIRGEFPGESEP